MKKLVRNIFRVVGVVVGIIILFQVFLMVRQSQSGKVLVHKNSQAIVRINADKILLGLAGNGLLNPGEYWKSKPDSTDRDGRVNLWNSGLSVPANLYLFSLPSDSSTFYAVFRVKDRQKLQDFLFRNLKMQSTEEEGKRWYAGNETSRTALVYNEDQLVVALGLGKKDRKDALTDILLSTDLVPFRNLPIEKIAKSKSDVTYFDPTTETFLQMDFSRGRIDLDGNMASDMWRIVAKPEARSMDIDSNIMTLWVNADIRPGLTRHKDYFAKFHVDIDSLQPYIGNYWEVQWKKGTVSQMDTVITFDYNENFDMVEKKEVRYEDVPDIRLSLRASPHLISSLPDKLFYKINKYSSEDLITLTTDTVKGSSDVFENEPYSLYFLYKKTTENNLLLDYFPWTHVFERIELKGLPNSERELRFKGNLSFSKKNIHPVKQLLDLIGE